MHRGVVGPVALNLVLRRVGRRVMGMALVVHIARMDPDDPAADPSGFRIPRDVIADLKLPRHVVSFQGLNKSVLRHACDVRTKLPRRFRGNPLWHTPGITT